MAMYNAPKELIGTEDEYVDNIKQNYLKDAQGRSAWSNWFTQQNESLYRDLDSASTNINQERLFNTENILGESNKAKFNLDNPSVKEGEIYSAKKNITADYKQAYSNYQAQADKTLQDYASNRTESYLNDIYTKEEEIAGFAKSMQNVQKSILEYADLDYETMVDRGMVEAIETDDGVFYQLTGAGTAYFDRLLHDKIDTGMIDEDGNAIYQNFDDYLYENNEDLYWEYTNNPQAYKSILLGLDENSRDYSREDYVQDKDIKATNRDSLNIEKQEILDKYNMDVFEETPLEPDTFSNEEDFINAVYDKIGKKPDNFANFGAQNKLVKNLYAYIKNGELKDGDVVDVNFGAGKNTLLYYQGRLYNTDKEATVKIKQSYNSKDSEIKQSADIYSGNRKRELDDWSA